MTDPNTDPITGQTYEEYMEGQPRTCECEIDWNCPLHRNRIGTYIETRYSELDLDPAERSF